MERESFAQKLASETAILDLKCAATKRLSFVVTW